MCSYFGSAYRRGCDRSLKPCKDRYVSGVITVPKAADRSTEIWRKPTNAKYWYWNNAFVTNCKKKNVNNKVFICSMLKSNPMRYSIDKFGLLLVFLHECVPSKCFIWMWVQNQYKIKALFAMYCTAVITLIGDAGDNAIVLWSPESYANKKRMVLIFN